MVGQSVRIALFDADEAGNAVSSGNLISEIADSLVPPTGFAPCFAAFVVIIANGIRLDGAPA